MDILKASGEKETYNTEKFCNSLARVGVPVNIIKRICRDVEKDLKPGTTTEQLHQAVLWELRGEHPLFSTRYRLRRAIMELGPAGFFFERYLALILQEYGYSTKIDQILQGMCVSHEIDIVAEKENRHFFIEAKYHNTRGVKSDVNVLLYSYARFLDIKEAAEQKEENSAVHDVWIVTNTRFTAKAIVYGECRKVKMTGWRYPLGESLESLIEQKALYPITALPSVQRSHWELFAKAGLMLAKDLVFLDSSELSKKVGIPPSLAQTLLKESSLVLA